jgi:DNA-binding MarR family transcriptional regulator
MPGKDRKSQPPTGRFAYEGLQRVFHERARLSVLSSLASHPDGLVFTELKTLCSLTDGNLSRQIQLLQESGLVETWKGYRNNRPQTLCKLTSDGRKQFLAYISALEEVVADARSTGNQVAKRSILSTLTRPSTA